MILTAPFAGLTAAIVLLSGIPALAAPTTVYAAGAGGVYRSTDGGSSWTNLTSAFTPLSLAIDPSNSDVIYAGVYDAVYKTTNGGTTWTKETNGLSTAALIDTIVIDPSNPNTIYAGGGQFAGGGVFKSIDGGVNWTQMDSGLVVSMGGIPSVLALALDPLSTNTLYVGGNTGLQAGKTTNGAASWTPLTVPFGFVLGIAIHPVNDSIVFTAGPFLLNKSINGGTTWTSPLSGFTQSIAIDPNTPSTMYADGSVGTSCTPLCATQTNTVYKSTDTGDTWSVAGALPSVNVGYVQTGPLVIDPGDTSTLYLGGDTGVSKSTDGGVTWTLVMPSTGINAIAMAPPTPPSSGTSCNGTYGGTFTGNLTISPGENCTFMSGAVTGNVKLNGGNLTLLNSQVGGNVQVNGGGTFTIGPGSTIGGNLQIKNLPSGAATNQVCGTTVQGDLQFQNNASAVLIGSASPPCAGNTIGGNLQVQNNTASLTIYGNTVMGNLQVQNNTGTTLLSNNNVTKNLQCGNNSSITGSGNSAGKNQGCPP